MRITNGIMMNNCLTNINKNKLLMDKLDTQISSTKKLQRPSDDPIAAIRALRLRSTYAEIDQYLNKNIQDASAWMEITDVALQSLQDIVGGAEGSDGIISYLNQGISEYQTTEDRQKIITTLKQFKDQLYADGNSDNAGRTIFTGYRTDSTLTFTEDTDEEYEITENLTLDNLREVNKIVGVDVESTRDYRETDVVNDGLHVVMLAYNNLNATEGLSISSSTNNLLDGATVTVRSYQEMGETVYSVQDDEIVLVPETGELIIGENYYEVIDKNDKFSVTYTKTGFEDGDLRPENYYYCTDKTTGITYGRINETTGEKYVEDQEIKYNINFNQTLTINVQGKDVLTADLGRDLDIIISAAEAAVKAHNKVDTINKKIEAATMAGDDSEVERLNNMLKAAELETAYAEDNLTKSFSSGVTLYQSHYSDITTQLADLGSRMKRLELNETRLESQMLTVKELKSSNEDTDIEATAVEFKQAQDVYDASLLVAAQIVQKSLLDFI